MLVPSVELESTLRHWQLLPSRPANPVLNTQIRLPNQTLCSGAIALMATLVQTEGIVKHVKPASTRTHRAQWRARDVLKIPILTVSRPATIEEKTRLALNYYLSRISLLFAKRGCWLPVKNRGALHHSLVIQDLLP